MRSEEVSLHRVALRQIYRKRLPLPVKLANKPDKGQEKKKTPTEKWPISMYRKPDNSEDDKEEKKRLEVLTNCMIN